MTDNNKINNFLTSVQNLLDSRSVFAYGYISELLNSVAECNEVYNVIAQCMVNFDFISEWQAAVSEDTLRLPLQPERRIAFIFSMFTNIDDRNLDLDKILEHYYSNHEDITSFEVFKQEVVIEFRNLILAALGLPLDYENMMDNSDYYQTEPVGVTEEMELPDADEVDSDSGEETDETEQTPEPDENEEDIGELLTLVSELKQEIRAAKKVKGTILSKTDLISIVSTLEYAAKTKSIEYFYALVLSIKQVTVKNKKLKAIAAKIEEISNKIVRS